VPWRPDMGVVVAVEAGTPWVVTRWADMR
jgi:hypothetical protein